MDDYACEYDFITRCRFFAAGQQQSCRGYMRRSDKQSNHCAYWLNMGGEIYHCGHPEAQAAAVDEFKRNNMVKHEG